jgi:DNA (cytosine-5)-methyltransferase 1
MSKNKRTYRAIDLYSGVGGWGLGLRMAGIEVIASYDIWGPANETNRKNNRHPVHKVDVRKLALEDLPTNIDIVVGSPPCTQFSYSNRGGSGDIDDGLTDVVKFLEIVSHVRPKIWAMENVPRLADIIGAELSPRGRLARFRTLNIECRIVNIEEFGLPQKRRRCIAGNFDFELLKSYTGTTPRLTLGHVVAALAASSIIDPIYRVPVAGGQIVDHQYEESLDDEEQRINQANKQVHPVYNVMSFPDRIERTVRTITATCTRVSRESVVIEDSRNHGKFRRLTVRERASLQGFPLTFQFYAASYGNKLRMVGNAFPPVFSYYLGQAFRSVPCKELLGPEHAIAKFKPPKTLAQNSSPDPHGSLYPWNRTFRFAIPSLHLKSGVRFELRNVCRRNSVRWEIAFFFGSARAIRRLPLDEELLKRVRAKLGRLYQTELKSELDRFREFLKSADVPHMQDLWSRRGFGRIPPFAVLDALDQLARKLIPILDKHQAGSTEVVRDALEAKYVKAASHLSGYAKLLNHAPLIAAGFLVAASANIEFKRHSEQISLNRHKSDRHDGRKFTYQRGTKRAYGTYTEVEHEARIGGS